MPPILPVMPFFPVEVLALQLRHGTLDWWLENNPTMFSREVAVVTGNGLCAGRYKVCPTDGLTFAECDWGIGGGEYAGTESTEDWFGTGGDGALTVSARLILTQDTFFSNLTMASGGNIFTGGFRLFVSSVLNLTNASAGAINRNSGSGVGASGGGALLAGSFNASDVGLPGGTGTTTTGGGGAQNNNGRFFLGGQAGASASGGSGTVGSAGGAGGNNIALNTYFATRMPLMHFLRGSAVFFMGGTNGSSGGSGGADGTTAGGRGGGGAGGSGIVGVYARTIQRETATTAAGAIQANGGNAGNGLNGTGANTGGGGAGAAAGGGFVMLVYQYLTGTPVTGLVQANGGNGGNGGNGTGTGIGGSGSPGSTAGNIFSWCGFTMTGTAGTITAPSSPATTPSGNTGGTGGSGGTCLLAL